MSAVTVFDFSARTLNGEPYSFESVLGKVLLIVNTASACGFTPQYAGLEELYQQYASQGFVVLGFPCNQFGGQEPGSSTEISEFCQRHFNLSFTLFEKIDVNGVHAHPLFVWLKEQAPGLLGSQAVKWNFTKFLVDRTGVKVKRFAPQIKPEALHAAINEWL